MFLIKSLQMMHSRTQNHEKYFFDVIFCDKNFYHLSTVIIGVIIFIVPLFQRKNKL